MGAVTPAAGRGSRLGELTADRPKGLFNVASRPLLAHIAETAVDAGADELVVVVGYEAGQTVDRFGGVFDGVPTTYVRQLAVSLRKSIDEHSSVSFPVDASSIALSVSFTNQARESSLGTVDKTHRPPPAGTHRPPLVEAGAISMSDHCEARCGASI